MSCDWVRIYFTFLTQNNHSVRTSHSLSASVSLSTCSISSISCTGGHCDTGHQLKVIAYIYTSLQLGHIYHTQAHTPLQHPPPLLLSHVYSQRRKEEEVQYHNTNMRHQYTFKLILPQLTPLEDIGRTDREQIRSRINNNWCRTFRPHRPLSTAYKTVRLLLCLASLSLQFFSL